MTPERDGTRHGVCAFVLVVLLLVSLGVCLYALLPPAAAAALIAIFLWAALPGVIMARRLYGSQRNPWIPAFLAGPAWGFGLTSLVLMVLWLAGVRSLPILALSPIVAMLAALPCGRLAGWLHVPAFGRGDLIPLVLVLALVPLVNGRPFARVGEMRPEGKAYRAYFIADFEWAMSVVAELSKGDVPPQNPFLAGDRLHYYWLTDLLSAIEYRAARGDLALEPLLLTNTLLLDLGFVAFLYFFVRHFVHSPPAAAIGCIGAVLFSSFEGTQQLYVFWKQHIPLERMGALNIDAISNWKFQSLKVDGLHRLLLYQRQHATAWAVALSALLVLVEAREKGRFGVNLLAGTLLAVAVLVSSFIALMVGSVVVIYQVTTLALRARSTDLIIAGAAGGVPVGLAIVVSSALQYVDRSGGQIVYVGHLVPANPWIGIFLSFGPVLIAAAGGAAAAVWRRASQLAVLGLIIAVSFFFYFYVDVVDHQHAYVGWRAGHLLFIAFAPLVGFAWQELSAAGRGPRATAVVVGILLAVTAAPMTIIDLYNTQDTAFQEQGPGFKWTEILTRDELAALAWVKSYTPPDALVQVDPVRESGTWAYMPAFGERRMRAGMPISMIPIQKYIEASNRVKRVFAATDAATAYREASELKLQYLYVGPRERRAYPQLADLLDATPYWFKPEFRNGSVSIYYVIRPSLNGSTGVTAPARNAPGRWGGKVPTVTCLPCIWHRAMISPTLVSVRPSDMSLRRDCHPT